MEVKVKYSLNIKLSEEEVFYLQSAMGKIIEKDKRIGFNIKKDIELNPDEMDIITKLSQIITK